MYNVQKGYALILGLVLLILAILGFILPGGTGEILGLFGVNYFQSVLHLIAAGFGIYAGIKGRGSGYNMTIGWIGIALGIIGFIPVISGLLLQYLNINTNISVLHLAVGIISLGVYYLAKK